ncbi:MAG: ATP-binding cassette domain-containing protein [Tissierellaceae bacterium]
MIKLYDVSKIFYSEQGNITAVKDISININKGEIYGIIGLSGAGKSTLIRCLNRLEEPTSGKIFIDGVDLISLNRTDLRHQRKNIGMIFQHFNLLSQKNVYDNIAFPLRLENVKESIIKNRVEELLEYVDLSDKKYNYPSQLSGGQKQRVSIARSIATNPKILLSDEATSALDPKTTKSILNLLKKIRDELNITIVMITHQMEVVKEICDRVAIMENGQIIEENSVEDLFKNPKSKVAKSFVNSINVNIEEEIINTANAQSRVIHLNLGGNSANHPIISRIIKGFNIDINILSGDIKKLHSSSVGYLILELIGEDREIDNALSFLKYENIDVEVI